MFKLRRSMLALDDYSQSRNQPGLNKWIGKFSKSYLKMTTMVPEWKPLIKVSLLHELETQIASSDYQGIRQSLDKVSKNCNQCHKKYRPLVTALYRTADYDDIQLVDEQGQKLTYRESMIRQSKAINRILIAVEDGQHEVAQEASKELNRQITLSAKSCALCHKDEAPRLRILGQETTARLASLLLSTGDKDIKTTRKLLSEIGVSVCARCHSTHRTLSDLTDALQRGNAFH